MLAPYFIRRVFGWIIQDDQPTKLGYHLSRTSNEPSSSKLWYLTFSFSGPSYAVGFTHGKLWTKPTAVSIAAGSLFDLTRSRTDLLAENAMLRQQLIVLKRQVKRPRLTNGDRIRLVIFARCTEYWKHALHIIQPDTLLKPNSLWRSERCLFAQI